ncbi:MAG: zinc ribbon domain-containing protein, partial [Cyanobacteria bacterium J06641_5]
MQICPQCQHDNPAAQENCEQCNASLTHKHCLECGKEVAISAESCTNCGTTTGAIWWAAIGGGSLTPVPGPATEGTRSLFLDLEQRYRLVEPKDGQPIDCGAVHDIRPLAPVPLREKIARGRMSWTAPQSIGWPSFGST